MDKAISQDGTPIAYDRIGHGPPIVLVVGAFNDRATGAPLAAALAAQFTAITYDRRGRGDSGAAAAYAVERELEDLGAVIAAAGGAAGVFGFSSGAALALIAAARGLPITRLALYDLPLVADGPLGRERRRAMPGGAEHAANLAALIAAGRRGDAVEYFQARVVGIPADVVARMRNAPFRPALEAMAHTVVHDATLIGDGSLPLGLASAVRAPTLAIAGGAAHPFMRETAEAVARAVPDGRAVTLDGATHDLVPEVLAPVLARFFAAPA